MVLSGSKLYVDVELLCMQAQPPDVYFSSKHTIKFSNTLNILGYAAEDQWDEGLIAGLRERT